MVDLHGCFQKSRYQSLGFHRMTFLGFQTLGNTMNTHIIEHIEPRWIESFSTPPGSWFHQRGPKTQLFGRSIWSKFIDAYSFWFVFLHFISQHSWIYANLLLILYAFREAVGHLHLNVLFAVARRCSGLTRKTCAGCWLYYSLDFQGLWFWIATTGICSAQSWHICNPSWQALEVPWLMVGPDLWHRSWLAFEAALHPWWKTWKACLLGLVLCDVVCKTSATWIDGLRLFHAVAATGTFPGFPVILVAEKTVWWYIETAWKKVQFGDFTDGAWPLSQALPSCL